MRADEYPNQLHLQKNFIDKDESSYSELVYSFNFGNDIDGRKKKPLNEKSKVKLSLKKQKEIFSLRRRKKFLIFILKTFFKIKNFFQKWFKY